MGRDGIRSIAVAVVGLGALVAAVGIAEVSTSWGGVYATAGLPMPPDSIPHGPFSSRNHYVGWMLMAFAVALAYWFAILREPHRATTGQLLVIQIAATVMAIAIVQTRSRAGILGLIFVTAMLCGAALHRATARSSRTLLLSVAAGLLIAAVASTGLHPILNRFVTHSWTTAHGRLPIWRQAAAIASDFPATGSGLNTYQTVVRFYPSKDIDHAYEGAHNDFLQLAVEGGVLIGLPALAVVGFFVLETGRRLREPGDDSVIEWLRLGSSVGLLVVAAQETVDFSLQIPGNAALFAVLAAMAVHHPPRKRAGATTLAGGGGTQPA
jgi:O-antigen ligase